jgi:hypothetical protein
LQERRGLRLFKVRNLLGRGKVGGTSWDPTSDSWKPYADVQAELHVGTLPDHTFWVEYGEMMTLFDTVIVAS